MNRFIAFATVLLFCGCDPQPPMQTQSVQQPIPDLLPNLSAAEYAEMSGFDASTEQTLREQIRNNDLVWRIEKLEREVRRLNQRIYGVAELRIGDEAPHLEETP